jgi:hypothetical protein
MKVSGPKKLLLSRAKISLKSNHSMFPRIATTFSNYTLKKGSRVVVMSTRSLRLLSMAQTLWNAYSYFGNDSRMDYI